MPTPPAPMSASAAVGCGLLYVYGVVTSLLILALVLPLLTVGVAGLSGTMAWVAAAGLFAATWCGAWAAWSVLIPRWRFWAYRRVDDLGALKRAAVAAGLIWPEGHFFEKTEIVPAALRRELRRLEQEHEDRKAGVV